MAQKRSDRLKVVERLIEQQEQQMARALGVARQQLSAEEQKQKELEDYLQSYQDELTDKSRNGVSGAQWQNYQFFIAQLEAVISQQQRTVARAQQQVMMVTEKWQQVNIKRKSISGLIDNIKIEEYLVQEKQEQKAIDELVNQMINAR